METSVRLEQWTFPFYAFACHSLQKLWWDFAFKKLTAVPDAHPTEYAVIAHGEVQPFLQSTEVSGQAI